MFLLTISLGYLASFIAGALSVVIVFIVFERREQSSLDAKVRG